MEVLPHSAPSWIFSEAEIIASSSLQDGAMEWNYFLEEHPLARHLSLKVLYLSMYLSNIHITLNIDTWDKSITGDNYHSDIFPSFVLVCPHLLEFFVLVCPH